MMAPMGVQGLGGGAHEGVWGAGSRVGLWQGGSAKHMSAYMRA